MLGEVQHGVGRGGFLRLKKTGDTFRRGGGQERCCRESPGRETGRADRRSGTYLIGKEGSRGGREEAKASWKEQGLGTGGRKQEDESGPRPEQVADMTLRRQEGHVIVLERGCGPDWEGFCSPALPPLAFVQQRQTWMCVSGHLSCFDKNITD